MPANLPQNASDVFDHLLPLGLQAYPDRAKEVNGFVVFKITGEGGGTWVLDCISTPPTVKPDANFSSESKSVGTIEMDHDSFKRCMLSPDEGMELYFTGKLLITGEAEVIQRLRVFFDLTRRNPGVAP
jgi:hypothetical protein